MCGKAGPSNAGPERTAMIHKMKVIFKIEIRTGLNCEESNLTTVIITFRAL